MNSLGIALICSALQATLLGLLAAVLYWLASRRGSILAARVAALSLGVLIGLTFAALCPLPSWWSLETLLGLQAPASTPVRGITSDTLANPGDAAPAVAAPSYAQETNEGVGIGLSLARLRDAWGSLSRQSLEGDASDQRWPAVVPVLFLIGCGLGLLRLVLGLGSVSRYRRRSRAIEDAALHAMLNALQVTMNSHHAVELRESSDVSAPATVGWQRPLILLPADWRTWTEDERRSVLAHELAHICHADYAAGLLARLSLIVHFYHPLAYWLASRLQFQQELAADALAASCVGGRGPYLRALAQLLLRQDDRPPPWPARAFLSPSGTLLRRIGMLRVKDDSARRTRSRSAAAFLFVVLTGGAVAVSALRGSAQQPADTRIEVKKNNTGSLIFGFGVNSNTGLVGSIVLNERTFDLFNPPTADNSRSVPFDLSYLPRDAVGVAAMRPAEFCRRPDAAGLIYPINVAFSEILKEFGLSGDPVVRLDAIEQIIGEVKLTHNAKAPKGHQNQLVISPNLIRMDKDFDWKERMRSVVPKAEEIHYRDKTYYKGKPKLLTFGLDICYFIPDARTLVLHSETTIRRVLDGHKGGSTFTASADWQRVEQGLVAVVMDMRRAATITKVEEPDLAPLFENTANLAFAIDLNEVLTMRAFANCADNKAAETLVRWAKSQIAEGIASLDQKRAEKTTSMPFDDQLWSSLLKHTRVEQHGSEATLRTHAAIDFAELGKLLMHRLTPIGYPMPPK
jgi:beta-lactamase regulating signal transducer with metallopeptidase domain